MLRIGRRRHGLRVRGWRGGQDVSLDAGEDVIRRLALVREIVELQHRRTRRAAGLVVNVRDSLAIPLALINSADVVEGDGRMAGDLERLPLERVPAARGLKRPDSV